MMTYVQAVVIALVQGVTEMFPISSLGHSVLVPAWIGGSWQTLVTQSDQADSGSSFYLAYIVALHCASALALLWFFRADWIRIIRGFFRSLPASVRASRQQGGLRLAVQDKDERLAWMIIFATIPVGIVGVALEHVFRTLFATPLAAAVLLFVNGLILAGAEVMRRTSARRQEEVPPAAADLPPAPRAGAAVSEAERSDERIARLPYLDAVLIGSAQILALLAGISRSGVTMVGGLLRGLDHEDAARFAFLLATPVILAAGVLKVPSLLGPAGAHIHGQVIVGVIVCGIAGYVSVRFLVRWFQTRTLTPFAIYCLIAGLASVIRFV